MQPSDHVKAATPLDVLLVLEAIEADTQGQKLGRRLQVLELFANQVREQALAEATAGLANMLPRQ